MNNHKISVLIIDSNEKSINHSAKLLQANRLVSEIEIVENTDQAILKTISYSPDIILLSYPSNGNAEKELIELVNTKLSGTTLVIVSETKEHAAFAIQNGIFKFLLKPIIQNKLEIIIKKTHQLKYHHSQSRISQMIERTPEEARIRIQTTKGYMILNPDDLIFCKSEGTYTELYLVRNQIELSSQYLLRFEEVLSQFNFLRVSRSYLINQSYIRKIYKNSNTIVLSCDGKEYEVNAAKNHIKNLSKFETE